MPVQTLPILTEVQVNVCEVFPCICSALFNETCLPHRGCLAVCLLNSQLQEQLWAEWGQNKSCLLLIIPNGEIYWRTWCRRKRIQVHNHHGCMLGFRGRGRVEQACLGEGGRTKQRSQAGPAQPDRPCTARQLQKQTSACSYLRFLHLNDPGGRHNDSSMSPQGTWLLNVM